VNPLSVRSKLTAWYGGLFLLAGVFLVVINYLLVQNTLPDPARFATASLGSTGTTFGISGNVTTATPGLAVRLVSGSLDEYRSSVLSTLLLGSAMALVVTLAVAVWLGWLMAGRVMRPLHDITKAARRLEAGKLDRRINLGGPADEMKELADTFDGMLDRLAESFDSQKRFVANASHELRTPLAVQRTLVEVAMAGPGVTPELRKLGTHLLHTNERSERMIEGLLILARSDRGLAALTPVRLDEVAAAVVLATAAQAASAGVRVETRFRPRSVAGDPVLLERLVMNLLVNAITYNDRGGWVYVEVRGDPALEVRNSGPVVPPEAVPTLFEPFRRIPGAERTGDTRHAGLGLSIVRSVAQAHGGSAGAQPGKRGGLTVTVRLPR
jgi:signal transduction histidine kinase